MKTRFSRSKFTAASVSALASLAIGVTALAQVSVAAQAAPSTDAKRIREDIHQLQGSEKEAAVALDRLKARPRAVVLAIVRDDLTASSDIPAGTLKAVIALDAKELFRDVKALCAKTENYSVFTTATRLAEPKTAEGEQLADLFQERVANVLTPVSKVAILDGLTHLDRSLPSEKYQRLSEDSNLEVRIATVRNFVTTRRALKTDEQRTRFEKALVLKPMQARQLAMEAVARMSDDELATLKLSLKASACEHESDSEVKGACLAAVKRMKRGGKA